jgi:chromosome segregation ATPase
MAISPARRNRYAQEAVLEELNQENERLQAQLFRQQTELISLKLQIESHRDSKAISERELRAECERCKHERELVAREAESWSGQHRGIIERQMTTDSQVSALEEQLTQLEAQLSVYRAMNGKSIVAQQDAVDRLAARVNKLKERNAGLHAELRDLKLTQPSAEEQIEELERRNRELLNIVEEERARTSRLAVENEELLVNGVLYQELVLELPQKKRALKAAKKRYREEFDSLVRESQSLSGDGSVVHEDEFADPDFAPDASPGRPRAVSSPDARAKEELELENQQLKHDILVLQEQVGKAQRETEEALERADGN